MRRRAFLRCAAAGLLLTLGLSLQAGRQVEVYCKEKGCGFRTPVALGGGFQFCQAVGWCAACKDLVGVNWPRSGARPDKTRPLGTAWNPATGKSAEVYRCPKCAGLFLALQEAEELKVCPKCAKPSLAVDSTKALMYD